MFKRIKWKLKRLNQKRTIVTRDGILFLIGVSGIIHESFFTKLDRPDLLVLFAAMAGLPAFLHTDERRRESKREDREPEPRPNSDTYSDEHYYRHRPNGSPSPRPNQSKPKHKNDSPYDDLDD